MSNIKDMKLIDWFKLNDETVLFAVNSNKDRKIHKIIKRDMFDFCRGDEAYKIYIKKEPMCFKLSQTFTTFDEANILLQTN